MSLRTRLTLLYSTLTGGILLLLGVVLLVLVNSYLNSQATVILNQTSRDVWTSITVDQVGEMELLRAEGLEFRNGVFVQLWNREGRLTDSSPALRTITESLDPIGMAAPGPFINDVYFQNVHMRVFSVQLKTEDGFKIGVLQVATPLTFADSVRQAIQLRLVTVTIISMALAAIASWLAIGKALSPLKTAIQVADQITHANDLSRRIPYTGPEEDEIGTLIDAFNASLERLENLFTAQQRFLADVSHELRTPLTVIKGNADLIRKFGADEESINSIKDETDRLSRMVGDLLFLAQAESGKLHFNLKPVEFDTLLLEVMSEMRVLAAGKISLKLSEIDQVIIPGERDRLKQVLINLISNAIHYTPNGGEVSVGVNKSNCEAHVTVRDTGPGIPAADLPHIFDRFYRAEKARTRSKNSGFGLGLSIAYWIVENHNGHIEVASVEGKGTTFTLHLPLDTSLP